MQESRGIQVCQARKNGQNAKIKDLGTEGFWRANGGNEGLALFYPACKGSFIVELEQCGPYGFET